MFGLEIDGLGNLMTGRSLRTETSITTITATGTGTDLRPLAVLNIFELGLLASLPALRMTRRSLHSDGTRGTLGLSVWTA